MPTKCLPTAAIAACLGTVLGLAGMAAADGPDVIVGELTGVGNYGTDTGSGVYAYAVGTTSCNKGTEPLQWLTGGNENRHPVIGQNLYKLDNGRLVQLGQSWLKHGFTALQGNVCGLGCTAHPNGTYLGVGCSDPYGASLNGSQSSLGPKSEVNAATGVFPYPPRRMPAFSGNTPKRLQAPAADLAGSPSALFFIEGQYIAQDDAASRNSANNASYRRATIQSTPPYTIALVASTEREKPAILAWREHGGGVNVVDPNVFIAPQDIPGDGRMILAWKVSQTGPNAWRYEYAVQNLTSDRCGQSFSVPFPAGANITGAGFHDVEAHSGERWDNSTDWTITVGANSVTWAGPEYDGTPGNWNSVTRVWTEPTGNDSTANALRWGTMYNFWFEADVAPGAGQGGVSMGLFRPGTPSQITWAAQTPGGATIGGQGNDSCVAATTIEGGAIAFSTAGATTDGPAACMDNGSDAITGDIWFRHTATCSGTATVSTCGSDFDTRIAVYAATECPTAPGSQLVCNDDSAAGCGSGSTSSQVTFQTTSGQAYLIRVGGTAGAWGNGSLSLTACPTTGACCAATGACTLRTEAGCAGTFNGVGSICSPNPCPPPVRPANDDCANATTIGDSAIGSPAIAGGTILATDDGNATCANSANSPDVWYAYTPAVSGNVTVDLCTADYDTAVAVFSGACPGAVQVGCDDDACGSLHSRVTVNMTAGTRYLIRAAGYSGNTGTFQVRVTGGGGTVASGACCTGTVCAVTSPGACSGAYSGDNTACGPVDNPTTCCRANFNSVGGVTVQDIFDYLDAWFTTQPAADIDGQSGVSLDDLFMFIGLFFAGCP